MNVIHEGDSQFAKHDQTKKCSQEDAGELLEHLSKHLCDTSIQDDAVDYFVQLL